MKRAQFLARKIAIFLIVLCQVLSLVIFATPIHADSGTTELTYDGGYGVTFNSPSVSFEPFIYGHNNTVNILADHGKDGVVPNNWWITLISPDGEYSFQHFGNNIYEITPPTQITVETRMWRQQGWSGYYENFPTGPYNLTFGFEYAYANTFGSNLVQRFEYSDEITLYDSLEDVPVAPTPTPTPTTETTPTPSPTIEPTITPTPTPIATPTPMPAPEGEVLNEQYAKLHPVLFIHGLNSYPDMWQDTESGSDYFALLKKWGYPEEYLAAYSYAGSGLGLNGYNNQGHIPDMAAGMRDAVLKLSETSKKHGGDGQIDIVAHSMGGLITRQYIREYPYNSHLNKVVAIGTPFQGSWIMSPQSSYTGEQKSIVNTLINFLLFVSGKDLDINSEAAKEMTPGSDMLKLLQTTMHSKVNFYTLYGDIKIVFREELFNLQVKSIVHSMGDMIVLPGSATLVSSRQPSHQYGFNEEHAYDIYLRIKSLDYAYSLGVIAINYQNWPHYHGNLPIDSRVQSRVIKILNSDE